MAIKLVSGVKRLKLLLLDEMLRRRVYINYVAEETVSYARKRGEAWRNAMFRSRGNGRPR